jgi:hypothetical protein
VATDHFLAYSCAAARDSHPLPCLRQTAKTRHPKDIVKERERKYRGKKSNGPGMWKSTVGQSLAATQFVLRMIGVILSVAVF